ncbi:MAG: protease inhibitor I42 family protein [Casimicrobiaceae bacterium]
MSLRAIAALAITALAIGGCMSLAPQTPTLVGAAQAGGSVHLSKGDTLVVALAPDPAAGARWRVQPMQGDVLQQIGMVDLLPANVTQGTVGARNDNLYRFRANSVGRTTLELAQPAVAAGAGHSVHFDVSVSERPGEFAQAWAKSR